MLKKIILCLALTIIFITRVNASDEIDKLFDLSSDSQQHLPYQGYGYIENDKAIFSFTIEPGAYLYQNSFKVSGNDVIYEMSFDKPPAKIKDALGEHEVFFDNVNVSIKILKSNANDILSLAYQGCDHNGICYPQNISKIKLPKIDGYLQSASKNQDNFFNQHFEDNIILTLLLSFLLGISLDLTPCVLPMLAIFSAMITGVKSSNLKDSLILNFTYVLALAFTYTIIGFIFAHFGMLSQGFFQHPVTLLLISCLFIVLALDCMEVLKIKIPSNFNLYLQNKIAKQKRGTLSSAFVFGILSALLATPCTSAPLAGALLYVTTQGNQLLGSLLFLSLGLGMGFPLLLIGVFGRNFLVSFGSFGKIIRNLLAIPLVLTAFYLISHLLGDSYTFILAAVIAFSCAYFIFVILKNKADCSKKLQILITAGIFCLSFLLSLPFIEQEEKLPDGFIAISKLSDLDAYKDQNLLLTFSAQWCANCHALDKEIYSSKEFKEIISNVKPIRIDVTDQNNPLTSELIKHYKIIGVPTYIIIDNTGKITAKQIGLFNFNKLKADLSTF